MLLKILKGDYLLIKNGRIIVRFFSIFQKKIVSKNNITSINHVNNVAYSYRKKSGEVFNNFLDQLKKNISNNYYEIILSSSGLIKSSYFDKLLWSSEKVAYLKNQNIYIDKNDSILSRAAYFSFKKKKIIIFGSSSSYSTFSYINKSFLWFLIELFRTIKESIKRLGYSNKRVISTDIMIVVSQPYQYIRLEGLIKALINDKKMSITIASPLNIIKTNQINSPNIRYENINSFRDSRTLFKTYLSIFSYWSSLKYVKKISKKFENLKVLDALLIESFIKWHYDHINILARTEILAKKMLHQVNPSMIYSIDGSDFFVRIFEKLSHENDLPTYCLPFAFLDESEQNWTKRSKARYGAINKGSSKLVKELTGSIYDVDVIGDPFYDNFYCNDSQISAMKANIGISDTDKIIAFNSFPSTLNKIGYSDAQYLKNEYELMLRRVIEVSITNGYHIIIKPHPVDNNNIKHIVNSFLQKERIHIVNDVNSLEMISIADIIVGVHSKVAFETILLNKKYLLLQWSNLPDIMKLIEYKVCNVSFGPEDLDLNLDSLLNVDYEKNYMIRRENYLKNMYVYPYDKCLDRLLKVFVKIIEKPSHLS